jgi:dihydroorotate dehydrogenase (fumarate)
MPDLSTTYMGLKLKNPIIVGSSNLTNTLGEVIACERAGAGAVVLKSLFEEQILADTNKAIEDIEYSAHAEAFDFFNVMGKNYYMDKYIELVKNAKEKTSIPIIASINCKSYGTWLDYAKDFENAGADALELNYFIFPANMEIESELIESRYIELCRKIKKIVSIPVSMKIGFYFTTPAAMAKRLSEEGIDALVLFNRFYRPDVDIEKIKIKAAQIFSTPDEISRPLQWIALISGNIKADIAASTGVHDAEGVIKMLLVGANAVQMCSALNKNKIGYIQKVADGLSDWMERHKFNKIEDFRGILSSKAIEKPEIYERSQYIKAIVGIS